MPSPVQRPDLLLLFALIVVVALVLFAYLRRASLKRAIDRLDAWFTPAQQPAKNSMLPLFLASFATLYIEIMMIRWIGTDVRIFAYMQNLALICCFLGFGLGCYWANRRKNVLISLLAITILVVLVQVPIETWQAFLVHLSNQLSISPDAAQWGTPWPHAPATFALFISASILCVTVFLFLLVVVMLPLGQWVGYYLDQSPNPVAAYTINLLGSLIGIWLFAGLSFYWLPVTTWFALGFLVLIFIQPRSIKMTGAAAVLLAVCVVLLSSSLRPAAETYWSPYQKLAVEPLGDSQYEIGVNNTGYMGISNLTDDFLARNPDVAQRFREESSYDAPFRFAAHRDHILIVGAGAGNDAAAALRSGAGQVDAVEIDPVIYSLGKRLHPEHPYDSPKVRVVLNDARAYLRRASPGYDVILFGLLDSHTQFSDYSNMRIDNYVYTEESFREAKRLLNPDGILIIKFDVREPWTWMGQRFATLLTDVFGRPPLMMRLPRIGPLTSATIFITSPGPDLFTRAAAPPLSTLIAAHPPKFTMTAVNAPVPPTDDWPYLYHRNHSIPRTYLTVSGILLILAVLLVGNELEPRRISTWHFFLLGAGFLLLETQMISRLALYFGTTWIVNCVVLTGILLILVVANFVVGRWRPQNLRPHYILLVLTLLGNYFFPWQRLPYSAPVVGLLLSIAYLFPVFFAGIIFTESFRRTERKSNAFGANIVGAVAGGLAQNASFIVGMKSLLLIAAFFYAMAGVVGLLESRPSLATQPGD